ncbi:MAG: PspA/IM30 family protein [Haloferacaceae archaeon]
MGLFDRTTDLATRQIDRLLDDLEDPAESAAYDQRRLDDELEQVDAAVVDLVTERVRQERRAERLSAAVDDHEERARGAVAEGREDLAREIIGRKREDAARREDAERRAAELREAEAELKARREELYERARRRRTSAAEQAAKERVARAETTVEGLADPGQVDEAEARAAALAELRAEGFFDASPGGELAREQTGREVEAELETLRDQIRGDGDDKA